MSPSSNSRTCFVGSEFCEGLDHLCPHCKPFKRAYLRHLTIRTSVVVLHPRTLVQVTLNFPIVLGYILEQLADSAV